MREQHGKAIEYDFTFTNYPADVIRFVDLGLLVPLPGNKDYELDNDVMFGYARKEVRTFIERLSQQYRSACGEKLVVTSLTRPKTRQPSNASPISVHPTGMAVDLRRSNVMACRAWLEDTLLYLEGQNVLEATRERFPPHYHVAVYTKAYARYVANVTLENISLFDEGAGLNRRYTVRKGDSLWTIARAHDTTVERLQLMNRIRGTLIHPGQVLDVPR